MPALTGSTCPPEWKLTPIPEAFMRRVLPLALALSAPALLAQSALLDDGRLDPACSALR
jgi:hypothetical protein